jgi:MazG family protein
MAKLRGPGGCPWSRSRRTDPARHLEETHEILEAIDSTTAAPPEVGDVLPSPSTRRWRQTTAWDVDDARGIVEKLIRRHPHVFGEVEVAGPDEVLVNWERIKAEEKGEQHVEHDIPPTLPALARASKVQRRAAGWGFDWRTKEGALAKLREEVEELAAAGPDEAEGTGDVLFAAAAVARKLGVGPERHRTTTKFAGAMSDAARARERIDPGARWTAIAYFTTRARRVATLATARSRRRCTSAATRPRTQRRA